MSELIKPPSHYEYFSNDLMTNFDHTIDQEVMEAIKGKPFYAGYTSWNFFGSVWYQDDKWYCQINQYGRHIETLIEDTLEEIMEKACERYGSE